MKITYLLMTIFSIAFIIVCKDGFGQAKVYRLVKQTNSIPGDINMNDIKKLDKPLKALAAFYSAMGGTMCNGEECELTTALGLGKQGSDAQKELIKKFFQKDKVAEAVLAQDCYLRPSGASTFSEYEYLTIAKLKDTVKVYYSFVFYNRSTPKWTKGPDIYLFKDGTFKKIQRKLWTFAER